MEPTRICPYTKEVVQDYKTASITNIQRGKVIEGRPETKGRDAKTYANITTKTGRIMVSATLDFCTERMKDVSFWFDFYKS